MDQRTQFIADYQRDVFTVVELADRYEVSRKTAYKWIDRYDEGGPAALVDRSRRPRSCPHATPSAIVDALLNHFRQEFNHERPHEALDQDTPRPGLWTPHARSHG